MYHWLVGALTSFVRSSRAQSSCSFGVFPKAFRRATNAACGTRLGARAATQTCMTVAKRNPTSEVEAWQNKCFEVGVARTTTHALHYDARVAEWRVLIG
jgi:hypothetical protein